MKNRIRQIAVGCVLLTGLTFGVNVDLNNNGQEIILQQPPVVEAAGYIDVKLSVLIDSAYRVNDPFLNKNIRVEGPVDSKNVDNGKMWISIGEPYCTANPVIYLTSNDFNEAFKDIKVGQYVRVSGKIIENQAELGGGYIMVCDTIEW